MQSLAAGIFAVCVLEVLLVMAARRCTGPARYILYMQAFYWCVSYLVRPLVLVVVQPKPQANDPIADWRLVSSGYSDRVAMVLVVIVVGLFAYLVAARLLLPRKRETPEPAVLEIRASYSVGLYFLGWICRSLTLLGITNAATATLASVAPVGAALLIMYSSRQARSVRDRAVLVGVTVLSEVAYSVLLESKTPLLAAAMFILIAFGADIRSAKQRIATFCGASFVFIGFIALQNIKTTGAVEQDLSKVDVGYPHLVQLILPLVRRFDLFSAATDAVFIGSGRWLSFSEFWERLGIGILPKFGSQEYVSAGVAWATEVRGQTIASNGSGVSLAEGFVAEGFAVGGFVGVVLEAGAIALATALVARGLTSRYPFLVFLAVATLARPAIFERGLLGAGEILGEAVQIATACYALWVLDVSMRNLRKDECADTCRNPRAHGTVRRFA
jgi:hypothetical protein